LGCVFGIFPDHPLAILAHVRGYYWQDILAIFIEFDGTDDGAGSVRTSQNIGHLFPIRPHLFDGVHDQLGSHVGEDAVKLGFIFEALFLIIAEELLTAGELFKGGALPKGRTAFGHFGPHGFIEVLV